MVAPCSPVPGTAATTAALSVHLPSAGSHSPQPAGVAPVNTRGSTGPADDPAAPARSQRRRRQHITIACSIPARPRRPTATCRVLPARRVRRLATTVIRRGPTTGGAAATGGGGGREAECSDGGARVAAAELWAAGQARRRPLPVSVQRARHGASGGRTRPRLSAHTHPPR